MEETLQALLAIDGPALLHVAIDQAANVWPLVPPNRNNTEMMDADEATTLDRIVMPASPAAAPASPAPAAALSLPSSSQETRPCATDSI